MFGKRSKGYRGNSNDSKCYTISTNISNSAKLTLQEYI